MNRLAIFLGAGFSKWAADLPLARELFDFNFEPLGVRETAKFQFAQRIKRDWDRLHPNEPSEKFISEALTFPAKQRQAVLWYIVRRLSNPFIRLDSLKNNRLQRHVVYIDEYEGHNVLDRWEMLERDKTHKVYSWKAIKKAKSFFGHPKEGLSGIITTNYDLLIEYSLGSAGFNYGVVGEQLAGRGISFRFYSFQGSEFKDVFLTGSIPLAKLHGSISWDAEKKYVDGRCGLSGKALIVAPTPEKSPPSNLYPVWDLSAHILNRTSHLIVFGFAFNPYDEAILNHLKENGKMIREVLLIDIAPNLKTASSLWPSANIDTTLPPDDGYTVNRVMDWIRRMRA